MKNDTQITSRQEQILSILRSGPKKRLILTERLAQNGHHITRITLIRDLNTLHALGHVIVTGTGKATTYSIAGYNPVLRLPEPNFTSSTPIHYQSGVLTSLHDLFTPQEEADLKTSTRSLTSIKKSLPHDIVKREFERFCIELSWKSSAIEGNTYSLLETEHLFKTLHAPSGHTRLETQMIINHKMAFETLLKNPPEINQLTSRYLRELHNILVSDLGVTTGFRKNPVGITGSSYLPLDNEWQIREAIDAMVSVINQTTDPLTKALVAISMISYIQPFSDGNKRTGRMLGNAILLSHDVLPLSYRTVNEITYKESLIIFYEQNTLLPFKQLFIEQVLFANATYFRTTK